MTDGQRRLVDELEIQDQRHFNEAPPVAFRLGKVVETFEADGRNSVEIEHGSVLSDIFVVGNATLVKGEVGHVMIGGDGLACAMFGHDRAATGWCDYFERADIGPDWTTAPVPGWDMDPTRLGPFTIDGGAAVGYVIPYGDFRITSSMYWHEPQGADQAIEVEMANAFGNDGYCQLFTHSNGVDSAACFSEWSLNDDGSIEVFIYDFHADGTYDAVSGTSVSYSGAEPVRLRLESDADGAQRAYVNGALVASAVSATNPTGPYVGMGLEPHAERATSGSPRILSACGGTRLGTTKK